MEMRRDMTSRRRVRKVLSGGQTGVDRAALDVAEACGIPRGGWCPRGRRAEDGVVPRYYPLEETPTPAYAQRTCWNVRDSDGTLVVLRREPAVGGTAATLEACHVLERPLLVVPLGKATAELVWTWLEEEHIAVLNIAGPRESEERGVYTEARRFLAEALGA